MENDFFISGIQQIGIGTTSLYKSWEWYAKYFNMDIRILEDDTVAEFMLPYTGNQPQKRHACITINLQGGSGFEIWQYSARQAQPVDFQIGVGDLGIFCGKIKSRDVQKFHQQLHAQYPHISPIYKTPNQKDTFFVLDPFGNYFQIIQDQNVYIDEKHLTGGCVGALIGVTDIEKSLTVYRDILGYDQIIYNQTGVFEDFAFMFHGNETYHRVLLTHSKNREGAFAELFGPSTIELVVALERQPHKIYENRYWGDPGFIQLCFDITNMKSLEKYCNSKGYKFTVDSCQNPQTSFDMGDASGQFTYIEDPDGTLIEFVETHKIPILKKFGLFLNLRNRNHRKPLSKFLLRMLKYSRVKF